VKAAIVASGGGVPGLAWHAGVLSGLAGLVEWASFDGVSAGALAAAIVGQDPATQIPYFRQLAEGLRTKEGHRWRTGGEIVKAALGGWLGAAPLASLGTHDRLGDRIRREIEGRSYAVPTWVGLTDIDTGEYLSVGPDVADWWRAVWASATIGPPLWPPVRWLGRRCVDGGYRSVAPLSDVIDRVTRGEQEPPDLLIVSSTRPTREGPMPGAERQNEIRHDSLRSVALLTDTIHTDDLEGPQQINRLVRQAEAAGCVLRAEDGRPYRYVPILEIRPDAPLARDALDDSRQLTIAAAGEVAASLVDRDDERDDRATWSRRR
jgi:predicted acylesterase/phospholipase RssA